MDAMYIENLGILSIKKSNGDIARLIWAKVKDKLPKDLLTFIQDNPNTWINIPS